MNRTRERDMMVVDDDSSEMRRLEALWQSLQDGDDYSSSMRDTIKYALLIVLLCLMVGAMAAFVLWFLLG